MMLKESFLDYLSYERAYSSYTVSCYSRDLDQFESYFNRLDSGLNFLIIDTDMVRGWMVDLMEQGQTTTTVNRKLSSLRSFYKYLLRQGLIKKDPMAKVRGPKKTKPLPVFVRDADMDRLLDVPIYEDGFVGVRNHLIIEIFYTTGMRLAELIGLNDEDVDMSARVIKVTGKRNKQRLIPFGEELRIDLENYKIERSLIFPSSEGAFFVDLKGKRINRLDVYKVVKYHLSKVVVLKKRSPHVLRHTFATSMLNNGAELEAVKELLGHESLAATQIYTHATFEELKKVYEQAHPRA